ncbi:spore gernimation protein GerPD [Jeotgalibacillus proteolyticus]|uniref:Spore gernimation protein GerPD n=1 Tax=Jeotgalibacillus proteolyticus TaxID=2082395 RepID=A0A2S5GHJ2_9BACL|nr:spore gernimation protein GerPD [Jeotgalibacillus proteolyticus]PPA72371.1 spore gernimation protein GerPD [Jeotgalibacillus proteolyticus]
MIVFEQENNIYHIQIGSVSSSSLLHIGDVCSIQLDSSFDTPPESLIIGPFVPLQPEG